MKSSISEAFVRFCFNIDDHRVHIFTTDETGLVYVSAHSAGAYTATLLVILNVVKEGGRAPHPPWANFTREEVFMEGPLEPNMGPSLADVLLCTFESTNAGFSSFPLRKLLSWE